MAAGVLYTYPENFRAYKVLIAAQYSGADVKIAPNFVFGETNKSVEFLKKFPTGKVPAFESKDGKVKLTESNAIAYYVSNNELRGLTPETSAEIWQWTSWADSELLPAACAWVFPYLGIMQFDEQSVSRARCDLESALTVLEYHLSTRTYLVGERVSLADVVVWCDLLLPLQHVLDPARRATYPHLARWWRTLQGQAPARGLLGELRLCERPPVVDAARYQELVRHKRQQDGGKKDKKQPQQQQQQQQQKKKEPKKKEEKPKEPSDMDLDLEDEKPKETKDPFDAMPKGTFNMDDFKRCYSNEDESKSIPYFWEKFDPQHYSIWYAEYKYPEELAKVFMSCNLITGMFQRLDKMRKQAFASVCLFGGDGDSTISGVWVWRGQELAFPLASDWQVDYESYDWRKLDPASADTKHLVQQYFSWSGQDKAGRPFNQGKIFK